MIFKAVYNLSLLQISLSQISLLRKRPMSLVCHLGALNVAGLIGVLSSICFLGLLGLTGCATRSSPASKGLTVSSAVASSENSSSGPADSRTSGIESPQSSSLAVPKEAPVYAKAKISLDLNKFSAPAIEHDRGLLTIYGTATQSDMPLLMSWGRDGRIIGRSLARSPKSFLLTQVNPNTVVVAFSPASGLVAGVEADGIFVRSLIDSSYILKLSRLGTRITSLEFSPNGESLLIGGADSMVYLWMFKDEELKLEKNRPEWYLQRYPGLGSAVSSLLFHPNGKFFIASDIRGTVSAWQRYGLDELRGRYSTNISGKRFLTSTTPRTPIRAGRGESVDRVALDQSAQFMAMALQDGTIEIWRLKGARLESEIKAHEREIYSFDFIGNDHLVSIGKDGYIKSWTLSNSTETKVLEKDTQLGQAGDEFKVLKRSISPLKDIYLPNLVSGAFVPGEGYFVGDKSGRIVSVDVGIRRDS